MVAFHINKTLSDLRKHFEVMIEDISLFLYRQEAVSRQLVVLSINQDLQIPLLYWQ